MKDDIVKIEQKDKTRRFIGAVLLCIACLCAIWGDKSNNSALLKFGKITAVVGITIYFSDRIEKLLKKYL